jgi:alkyldihydroxyacetonephosphate synthase
VLLRGGQLEAAPDAVLLPADAAAVRRALEACAAEGVAVVPFGGGTSVVGGVEPLRGRHPRLVSLDLARLRGVEVDRRSLTARLGAGLRGPEAEAALNGGGVVLGHFPQSFEYATVGGFAATRSAGQASSGYGRFDALVSALRLVTPAGELTTLETPHSAAGPSLRELALGSEGVFGVIPEVTVRVRPAPAVRRYEAWMAESFEAGAEIVRALAQGPGLPDVIRVSDEEETEISLALSGPRGVAGELFGRYLGLRRRRRGCLVVVGIEGDEESVARRRALAVRELRRGGAAYLGQAAGRSWEHGRFQGPYLRDTLMDMGAMVETLETSHTWSRLGELHDAVAATIREALAAQGTPGLAFCHLSHAYADGASLYFTFIARARHGAEIEQWAAVKRAASEAIAATGGTITHHHAVGRDHAPYMEAEVGETGIEVLRAVKERLDPAGIMNPGKLMPSA